MKTIINNILIILIIIFTFFLGLSMGKHNLKTKIVMSERQSACEAKGGKYNYFYNNYSDSYYEKCEIIEKEIKDF